MGDRGGGMFFFLNWVLVNGCVLFYKNSSEFYVYDLCTFQCVYFSTIKFLKVC